MTFGAAHMPTSKAPRAVSHNKSSRSGAIAAKGHGVMVKDKHTVGKAAIWKKDKAGLAQALAKDRSGRLAAFFGPKGLVSVELVAKHFGMSKVQIAETIGVKRETIYRADRVRAPKTQARATEMLEIVGRIADWAGGEKQAMAWYRAEPIAAFGGRTAESLVKEGRAAAVRDYLDHVATGGFA
jgi:hypothetical protein